MCEENILIEIGVNEEHQMMLFNDRLRAHLRTNTHYNSWQSVYVVWSGQSTDKQHRMVTSLMN